MMFPHPLCRFCLFVLCLASCCAGISAQQPEPGRRLPVIPLLPEKGQTQQPPILIPPLDAPEHQAPLSVVLVMGTGQSMQQGKLLKAQEAAADFLKKLDPKAKTGLVLYHHKPYQTSEPGTDRKNLMGAISAAKAGGGNAWRDAAAKAIDMLAAQNAAGPRVVLLVTDGEDVGSKITLPQLAALAAKQRVRIWAVQVGAGGQGQPVRSVLTLDRSNSMKKFISHVQLAAVQYILQMPQGMGDATIVTFANDIEKPLPLQGRFTSNQRALALTVQVGMDKLQLMTRCWSATSEAIETLKQGRVAGLRMTEHVILFTDGKPVGEPAGSLEKAIAEAKKQKVAVHVLLFAQQPPAKKKKKAMQKAWPLSKAQMDRIHALVNGTGGSLDIVVGAQQIVPKFAALARQLRPQFEALPTLQTLAQQTEGIYGPVPNPDDLPAGLEWMADRLNERMPKKQ